jgi:CDP-diacylglycerol--glycerol-3-phosphate 3-phosphatidyltransferase
MMACMNLPTALTIGRLVLAPVFFGLYMAARSGSVALVAALGAVFVLIEASDLLDGHLARTLKQESEAGKVLDPLADSVSRLTYFICFAGSGFLPLWVLLILVYRDVGVSYVRVLASRRSVMLAARVSGKVKAWVYGVSGGGGIVVFAMQSLGWAAGAREAVGVLVFWLFVASAAVALWSLADYGISLKKVAG